MFRSGPSAMETKMLGVIYFAAQMIGGILAGLGGIVLLEPADVDEDYSCTIEPIEPKYNIPILTSEFFGSAVFISMFLIYTEKRNKVSKDKVINAFVISSAYIGARLMSGGHLLTGIPENIQIGTKIDSEGTLIPDNRLIYKNTGSLLNPAIALGTQIISIEFHYAI